jgi:hypothetical protein
MDLRILIAIFAGLLWLPLSVVVGVVANKRGRFGFGWFLLSVIVTPIVTGLLLLALPRRPGVTTAPPKDVEPQSRSSVDQVEITASPKLRLIFIVVAATMLVLWGLSLIPPIESWGSRNEDGFSYVTAFWATIICVPVALYLLVGAIDGRGRHVARVRNALFIGCGTLFIVGAFLIFQHIANSMGGLGLG